MLPALKATWQTLVRQANSALSARNDVEQLTRALEEAKRQQMTEDTRLAAAGKAVIMISSELPEVLGMADRIVVMHEGRIAGEIVAPRQATQADVLALAIGRPIDTQEPR